MKIVTGTMGPLFFSCRRKFKCKRWLELSSRRTQRIMGRSLHDLVLNSPHGRESKATRLTKLPNLGVRNWPRPTSIGFGRGQAAFDFQPWEEFSTTQTRPWSSQILISQVRLYHSRSDPNQTLYMVQSNLIGLWLKSGRIGQGLNNPNFGYGNHLFLFKYG